MKNQKKKTDKTPLIQFQLFVSFLQKPLVYRKIFKDGHYPSGHFPRTCAVNRVFLSRNYPLIVARRKFDVLKTNICLRSEASRENMLVLRTSNFQGATIRPIVPRQKHSQYCPYCSPQNFLPHANSKIDQNSIKLFSRF